MPKPSQPRRFRFEIRLTAKEFAALQRLADKLDMTDAEALRHAIVQALVDA